MTTRGGVRARLRYAPPGWTHQQAGKKYYFEKAQRFIYILYGDMDLVISSGPRDTGKKMTIRKDFFIDQPPKSIWAWPEGTLSEAGCMWLEVTYAQGTRVGKGPIEKMKTLR